MKRALLTLALILSVLGSYAQQQSTLWFRTTEFAWKYMNEYGRWTDWSDWEKSNMKVKIDLNRDQIVIFSSEVQIYTVLSVEEPPYDSSGQQVKYRVIDQEDDYGHVRLRVTDNGNCQIYVDFADLKWVYNVVRIQ